MLVFNSAARIAAVYSEGKMISWAINAPLRGRPLAVSTVEASESTALSGFFERLISGQRNLVISGRLQARLRELRLLVPERDLPRQPLFNALGRDVWSRPSVAPERWLREARKLRDHRFVILRGLLSPALLAACRNYARGLKSEGFLRFEQGRHVAHNEAICQELHRYLALPVVNKLISSNLVPSYSFLSHYPQGSSLKEHVDREQCELTLTVMTDFRPRPAGACSWPLILKTETGKSRIYLGCGDGLLFYGRELPHRRPRLTNGRSCTCILFHFVKPGFKGSLS